MTREEATIQSLLGHIEALEETIKSLEQQSSEDCVGRQAVDHLCFEFLRANSDDNIAFYEHFRDLPSVTPTHKKGRWIFAYGTKGKDNVEKCSCCDSHWREAIIYRKDTKEYLRTRLLYCPNCGAEMESEE